MLAAYRAQDWDHAEALLAELKATFDQLDLGLRDYLQMYTDRVADLRQDPPDPDWDGVFSSTRK